MRYVAALAVLFLLLLGAAAYFLFVNEAESGSFEKNDAPEVMPNSEPRRDLTPVARPHVDEPDSSPSKAPTSEAHSGFLPDVEGGLLVRCVDANSGAPVPDAEVLIYNFEMLSEVQQILPTLSLDLIADSAMRYRSDAEGCVRVLALEGGQNVVARSPTSFGRVWAQDQSDEVEVAMQSQRSILVRVVDRDGVPIPFAPVAWRSRETFTVIERYFERATARCDAAGRARLVLDDLRGMRSAQDNFVVLDGLFADPVQQAIDLDALPSEGLTLVAPPHGSIAVVVHESSESKAPCPVMVAEARLAAASSAKISSELEIPVSALVEKGHAVIPLVGLGLSIDLKLRPSRRAEFMPLELSCLGPKQSGETVEVEFHLPDLATRCVLLGRLLTEKGLVMSDQHFMVMSRENRGSAGVSHGVKGVTDAKGTFRIAINPVILADGDTWTIEFSVAGRNEVKRRASLDFSGRGSGEQELGDVTLVADPLIASGRVIGPTGEPISGANVMPRGARGRSDASGRRGRSGAILRRMLARTDADGNFEIRGSTELGELELLVSCVGFEQTSAAIQRGASGLEIRLAAQARIKALVARQDGGPLEGLERAILLSRRRDLPEAFGSGALKEGGLVDEWIGPGNYVLRIVPKGQLREILYESEPFELESGTTMDLGKIVVAYAGTAIHLDLINVDKSGFVQGEFRLYRPGSDELVGRPMTLPIEHRTEITTAVLPVEIEVVVPGYRPTRKLVSTTEARFELEAGYQVELTLSGIPEDLLVQALIMEDGFEGSTLIGSSKIVNSRSGPLRFATSKTGKRRVDIHVGAGNAFSRSMSGIDRKYQPMIEIADLPGITQKFDLALDPKAIESALKMIRGGR